MATISVRQVRQGSLTTPFGLGIENRLPGTAEGPSLGDAAYAHDRRVRLIDDGQTEDCAELAGVGDRDSGTFDVFGLEFLAAGALTEVGDAALQAKEVEVTGVLEDGDDESPVEGDGDSHVDVAVVADVIAFERGVDDR